MKKVVLIGTDHGVQRGELSPEKYIELLREVCERHHIEGIAEEIKNDKPYLAETFCIENRLKHLIIEPNPSEHEGLGIPSDAKLVWGIENEFEDKYPKIRSWPHPAVNEKLPDDVFEAFNPGWQEILRARERVWLKRIEAFDVDTILCICGANHFEPFSNLMKEHEIEVVELYSNWMPELN